MLHRHQRMLGTMEGCRQQTSVTDPRSVGGVVGTAVNSISVGVFNLILLQKFQSSSLLAVDHDFSETIRYLKKLR